jgi:L-fucose mutarotase
MLRTSLTHPGILAALASVGHGSTVLIADGNFPFSTAPLPSAPVVFLNLAPGLVTVTDVLGVVVPALPIEAALLMDSSEATPEAHGAIRACLPADVPTDAVARQDFYSATRLPTLGLVVATGDSRPFANVLLTVGVVPPSTSPERG